MKGGPRRWVPLPQQIHCWDCSINALQDIWPARHRLEHLQSSPKNWNLATCSIVFTVLINSLSSGLWFSPGLRSLWPVGCKSWRTELVSAGYPHRQRGASGGSLWSRPPCSKLWLLDCQSLLSPAGAWCGSPSYRFSSGRLLYRQRPFVVVGPAGSTWLGLPTWFCIAGIDVCFPSSASESAFDQLVVGLGRFDPPPLTALLVESKAATRARDFGIL